MKDKRIITEDLFFSKTWEFLNEYMPNRLNRSLNTIESYKDSLTVFRRFVLEKQEKSILSFKFTDCTRDCIFDFSDYLKEKGNATATINLRITAIHTYLAYAADEDISVQSIALLIAAIPPLKVPKKEKAVVDADGLKALFSSTTATRFGIRDQTFMVLIYDSAIRLGEITPLR